MPAARFCPDCGHELAGDTDGKCPMCTRIEQFRAELGLPSRASQDGGLPVPSPRTSPTASKNEAIISKQGRGGSKQGRGGAPGVGVGESAATVIRTRALRQRQPARKREPTASPSNEPTQTEPTHPRQDPSAPRSGMRAPGPATIIQQAGVSPTAVPPPHRRVRATQHRASLSRSSLTMVSVITVAVVAISTLVGVALAAFLLSLL